MKTVLTFKVYKKIKLYELNKFTLQNWRMKFSFFFFAVIALVIKKINVKLSQSIKFSQQIQGKIMVEKWDLQFDKQHLDINHELKDSKFLTLDAHSMTNAPDVLVSFFKLNKCK